MNRILIFLATAAVAVLAGKANRTSCFQYVSCLETSQDNYKTCAGGAGISLTLESKDVNIRDLVEYRALEFVGCQDRLLKEIVDFEALQILVNQDARECFEKLPASARPVEPFTDSCDYVEPINRSASKGNSFQCFMDYKKDREYCETLLECCPDHSRCAERMNAVSFAYQSARLKAQHIVSNMISCIAENDPRFVREGERLQTLRDPYRNAGIPFLKPDRYTEDRIERRLANTNRTTLEWRRQRFNKKYQEIRQQMAEKLINKYTTTTSAPEVVDEVQEGSTVEVAEEVDVPSTTTTATPESTTIKSVKEEILNVVESTTLSPEFATQQRVARVRELIRTASDKDLSKYVLLISEGKFAELFELAERSLTEKKHFLKEKVVKEGPIVTKDTEIEEVNTTDSKVVAQRSLKEDPKLFATLDAVEEKSAVTSSAPESTTTSTFTDQPIPTIFTISESLLPPKNLAVYERAKNLAPTARLAHTIVDRASRDADEKKKDEKKKEESKPEKEEDQKKRVMAIEEELKVIAEQSKIIEEAKPKIEIVVKEPEAVTDLPVTVEASGEAPEVAASVDDNDVEASGEEEEEITTLAAETTTVGIKETTTEATVTEEEAKIVAAVTEEIKRQNGPTSCQKYAACWQTVHDYHQQCDRKYSVDVLSHGIDDPEIFTILQNHSISHHDIVVNACLRPLDRATHATLKQLLTIQRGVRKACLDLGREKILVSQEEIATCRAEVPSTDAIDNFLAAQHVRSQHNHLTCLAQLEPVKEACQVARGCCASVDTCDKYLSTSPVKKLENEAINRLVKKQNDCEEKMLETLKYIHEQLSLPNRRRMYYYH